MGDLLEQALDDDDEYETTDTEPVVEPVAAPRHSRAVSGQPSDQVRWWSFFKSLKYIFLNFFPLYWVGVDKPNRQFLFQNIY